MIFAKPWADALIVLVVVLLFFGPKRLPGLGKSLGEGMREFKDGITGHSKADEHEQPALNEAAPAPASTPAPSASAPPGTPASAPPGTAPAGEPETAQVASSEHRS